MNFQKMLKMTTEKRVFLGGLLGGFTYWANRSAREFWAGYPPELGDRLDPHLPTNGQIIASVAPPGVLYLAKKVSKSTTTKEKVGDVAFGSVLYCIPHLIEKTGVNAAYAEGVAARPAVAVAPRVPATYKVSAVAPKRTVAPTVGKYRVTA